MKNRGWLFGLLFLLPGVASAQTPCLPNSIVPGCAAPSGPATGDLSGTYPNPQVARINGNAVSTYNLSTTTGPGNGTIANLADVALRTIYRGAWAASTAYAVNDEVTNGGLLYIAPAAFTSGSSFNASNWTLIALSGGPAADGNAAHYLNGAGAYTAPAINFPIDPTVYTGSGLSIAASDAFTTKILNSAAITVTFAQSTSSYFPPNSTVCFINENTASATLTITGTPSVFKGAPLSSGNFILPSFANWCVQTDPSNNYVLSGWSPPPTVSLTVALVPQGRLSLSSTNAVQNADVASGTILYYLPYAGSLVPIYNGGGFTQYDVTGGLQLSVNNSTNFPASTLFDVYATVVSGTPTLIAVPWGTSTAGASARGSSDTIARLSGLWVNSVSVTGFNGATSVTAAINQATLLGSFVTTSAGSAIMSAFQPAAAAGGPVGGAFLGYANIYNTVAVASAARDNTASITTTTVGVLPYDNTATGGGLYNSVFWIDPIGSSPAQATFQVSGHAPTTGTPIGISVGVNSQTTPAVPCSPGANSSTTTGVLQAVCFFNPPQASGGLNYIQGFELNPTGTDVYSGTVTVNGVAYQQETLRLGVQF